MNKHAFVECSTHVDTCNNKRKAAFTLAEVLITLAIIGVVAAITLSSVINKYQKTYLQKRFVKSYNTLAVAIQKTYADMGYIAYCGYSHDTNKSNHFEECAEFESRLANNLKIVKECKTSTEAAKCTDHINGVDKVGGTSSFRGIYEDQIHTARVHTHFLSDGIMYGSWTSYPFYLVDTNGKKGPNKWGYDVFIFWVGWQRFGCYENFAEPGGIGCSDRLKNINR